MRALLLLLGCSLSLVFGQAAPAPPKPAEAKQHLEDAPAQVAFSDLQPRFRPAAPAYPPLARLAGIQGVVTLGLTLDALGSVKKVERMDGPAALRPAAAAFGKQWLFEPVEKDGKRGPVQTQMGVAFRLQDVAESDAASPIPPVVLSVAEPKGGLLVPIDLAPIRRAAAENLADLGFPLVEEAKAAPENALSLQLRVRTMKTAQGVFVYELIGRLSRMKDRDLADNEPGKPQRVWLVGRVLGQKGKAGLEDGMANTALRVLGELTAPGLPRGRRDREDTARAQILFRPLELREAARSPVVDFDFSQLKVKRQPPAPSYPALARANNIQGLVVVDLIIDPEGHPASAEALEGPPELLVTTLSYALQWEFEPARLNGIPQWARFKLTMPFKLREDPFPSRMDPRRPGL